MSKMRAFSSYHGSLTDQLRKIAARISSVISVTTALPFLKKTPAIAGNRARARGADCQCDSSFGESMVPF